MPLLKKGKYDFRYGISKDFIFNLTIFCYDFRFFLNLKIFNFTIIDHFKILKFEFETKLLFLVTLNIKSKCDLHQNIIFCIEHCIIVLGSHI